ncbi:hypothetical protein [Clostridium estertheticum]|uniref:hypothetical protein n=1 Tax=Clostridium estertheticum TaxID=238834 RepID=UPI001C0A9E5C|nr:hypothetical protein [Clostridium estertheticum]MBU3173290.1 hypothetical protein [Clostridium estertheticum]
MKQKPLLLSKDKEEGNKIRNINVGNLIKVKTQFITNKIFTFYTTEDNSLKDSILTNVGVLLAKKSEDNRNILIIDFNGPTPNLDHYLGVTKEVYVKDIYNTSTALTGVTACFSAIEKGLFNSNLLKTEFVKPVRSFKNLSVLTGVYDRNMFEKITAKHYEKILEVASEVFDTILISTNPYLADAATFTSMQKCTKAIIISNATYTGLRAAFKDVEEELIKYQNFPKDKFDFIVGNMSSRSLDKQIIKEILKGYKILGYVNENKYAMAALNNKIPLILTRHGQKDVVNYINIIANMGYIPKLSFLDNIFKKKHYIESEKGVDI